MPNQFAIISTSTGNKAKTDGDRKMSAIKRGSKEFYDVMDAFEMHAKNSAIYVTDFTRVGRGDDKTPSCYFYENGKTNDLFHMFMRGYVSAKAAYHV